MSVLNENPLGMHADQVILTDNFVETTAASTLTTLQRVVTGDTTAAAYTTKLPPVREAAGLMFFFYFKTDNVANWTVADYGDDPAFTHFVFDDAGDTGCCISDGFHWHKLESEGTA